MASTQQADSSSSSASAESIRIHLECPICNEIPRDGVMLMCVNGHNVCAACKDKIGGGGGRDPRCPQGRCAFANPPARNFTVAGLVSSLGLEWPCRYSLANDNENSGCTFKGNNQSLEAHEAVCAHRQLPCMFGTCDKRLPVDRTDVILGHLESAHSTTVLEATVHALQFKVGFKWRQDVIWQDGSYGSAAVHVRDIGWVVVRAVSQNGNTFVYPAALLPESEAARLECTVSLERAGNAMSFRSPVYTVGWSAARVLRDPNCASFSVRNFKKMLSDEGLSPDDRSKGYSIVMISFTFKRKD